MTNRQKKEAWQKYQIDLAKYLVDVLKYTEKLDDGVVTTSDTDTETPPTPPPPPPK